MALRFLVVEGNTRQPREKHRAAYGTTPSEGYVAVLRQIAPDAVCDIALPADEGFNLPGRSGLESYDGVVLTGSSLNIYDGTPEILRQIDLMRAVYASGTPCFGSCWGIQVASVAAGGDVQANPRGLEAGFARDIAPTQEGRAHPLLAGRPAAFAAPAVHTDAVVAPAPGTTILAGNALAPVQAAEIRHEGGVFWGVQYHPEFDLRELAIILARLAGSLVEAGHCTTPADAKAYADDLLALHAQPGRRDLAWRLGLDAQVLDPVLRTTEIRNFVESRVRPEKSARGRA